MLKIVTWKEEGEDDESAKGGRWEVVKNMRGARRNSLKDCSLDVQWNPR